MSPVPKSAKPGWPDARPGAGPALYTHTLGTGSDVVLVHGWGMHSGVWEDVAEALFDHHRVTAVSYTHLDVYKRQSRTWVQPLAAAMRRMI